VNTSIAKIDKKDHVRQSGVREFRRVESSRGKYELTPEASIKDRRKLSERKAVREEGEREQTVATRTVVALRRYCGVSGRGTDAMRLGVAGQESYVTTSADVRRRSDVAVARALPLAGQLA